MASSSALSPLKRRKYDVFLSFRSEDTCKAFVDHLYHALDQKGIITYKDDEEIQKGERISDQLLRSIEESRIHIIVFSKNYASSSWCLDELVKIMECQKIMEHTAYSVFYDVEPTEVRHQTGAFEEAFKKHVEKEGVERWRAALKEATGMKGWDLKTTANGGEDNLLQKIVQGILLELSFIDSSDDEKLVGMETRVKNVVSSLETSVNDVRVIGIKGMGGSGKTTLARAVYDHISTWFEGKSFVENVREVSKGSSSGLRKLQKRILKDVLNEKSIDVPSVSDGKDMMKKIMCSRKVLLVLDDVDHIDQLEALAGGLNWFKPGSRIIITTRDEQVLMSHQANFVHDVNLLSNEEAICLFSKYAFGREIPIQGYEELSENVVDYAAGLPLSIKVLGSHLCGKIKHEWEHAIKRLKSVPLKETIKRLELSFDNLEDDYKEIFLDVACNLKGATEGEAIRALESCGLHARTGLRVLEQKSLITISNDGRLLLHHQIEEMGRNIVRRLHPDEPKRHSRLWIKEEIEDILVNDLGTEETRSIKLMKTHLNPDIIMNGLAKMKELRSLYADNGYKPDLYASPSGYNYPSLPNTLRYLHWRNYPLSRLPETFRANNLVYLAMPHSNISQLWEGGERKIVNKLRFLDLTFSRLRTLDLGMTPHLEKLTLSGCNDFLDLHMPLEYPKLKYIDLGGSKVSNFNLGLTPHLEELNLRGCKNFVELHMPVECPNLKYLDLSSSKVSKLNLGLTPNLERLDLKNCYLLQEIHAPVGCLKMLFFLNLSGCSRFEYFFVEKGIELPSFNSLAKLELTAESLDVCPLHPSNSLPKLRFKCKYDEPLPSSSGNLEKLISFGLCACTNLESFSAIICSLQQLGKLTLEGSIPEVPKDLYWLESLEELTLSKIKIKHLPDSICMMEHLKSLELKSCFLLEHLPKDLGKLKCLEKLHLSDCMSLQDIPNIICNMKCLKYLHLPYCGQVKKLPDEIGRLECLEELNIEGTRITQLPQSIFQLERLCIVWARGRLESYGFTSFKELSRYTASCYIKDRKALTTGVSSTNDSETRNVNRH